MTFHIGVDYYPEHWPRERWETYAAQMQQAHFNVVRLAEFSWIRLEPTESCFDFEWLDDAIQVLYAKGLSVILGTPTAAMPAWVKYKYPETLASSDGHHRDAWGLRKNNCFSSGTYRLLSERITQAMAERYADNPAVIGWQTDNEFDGPVCRCVTCRREFRVFLRDKYGSLETLNIAWGTQFWGHTFSQWDEIPVSTSFALDNPSLCLDWQRFQTSLQVRFQRDQVLILRRICPRHFITHNFMGFSNVGDCFALAEDLDFAALDSYPGFPVATEPEVPYGIAAACDLTRGLKGKNFWIMETTAGPTGWGEYGRNLRPGEMRKTFFHHVAHGADGQLFFRWRTCTAGREQYWHGLLGHDGLTGRRYREAAEIAQEAEALAPYLESTTVKSQVAMIYDYDSRWATQIQPSFVGNAYVASFQRYYNALLRAGVNVDILPPQSDLAGYRLVVAPQLHVLPDATAMRLAAYVYGGGVLLTDARTGVKTETNLCHERTLPGLLSEALGIRVDEYGAIAGDYAVSGGGRLSGPFLAHGHADWVTPTEDTETLMQYSAWHMCGFAAVTRHRHGYGTGYYVGTFGREDAFYDALAADVLEAANVRTVITPPPGVEVSVRQGAEHALVFLINHVEQPQTLNVPSGVCELLSRQETTGRLTLDRFGVAVLQLPRIP